MRGGPQPAVPAPISRNSPDGRRRPNNARNAPRSGLVCRPDYESYLIREEANRTRPDGARENRDVVELLHQALNDQPVLDIARGEINHRQMAERLHVLAL